MVAADEGQGALDAFVLEGEPEMADAFENAGGDVRRARVDHRVVIGEWHLGEQPFVVVLVKTGPATIAVLHAEHPADAAPDRRGFFTVELGADAVESHQDHDRVIHVGIKLIVILKIPAADRFVGLRIAVALGVFHAPIARATDFLVQEPATGLLQGRVIGCEPGFVECVDAERGVPDGRETWLKADGIAFFNLERIHLAQAVGDKETIVAVPERAQRHDIVGHSRKDRPEPAGCAAVFDGPALGQPQRIPPQRLERVALEKLEIRVDQEKEVVPGERFRITRQPDVRSGASAGPELFKLATRG